MDNPFLPVFTTYDSPRGSLRGFFGQLRKQREDGFCVEHIRNSSERCKYYNAWGGATMKLIDNVNTLLKDDLAQVLKKDSKVAIAAAYFSIRLSAPLNLVKK